MVTAISLGWPAAPCDLPLLDSVALDHERVMSEHQTGPTSFQGCISKNSKTPFPLIWWSALYLGKQSRAWWQELRKFGVFRSMANQPTPPVNTQRHKQEVFLQESSLPSYPKSSLLGPTSPGFQSLPGHGSSIPSELWRQGCSRAQGIVRPQADWGTLSDLPARGILLAMSTISSRW